MKLSLATAALAAVPAVAGYNMGGYFYSPFGGSPFVASPRSRCAPSPQQQAEAARQQQEWISRAFDMANEVANEINSRESSNRRGDFQANDAQRKTDEEIRQQNEEIRQQQKEWVDRAFGLASDLAGGSSSPRFKIMNKDDMFQVAMDVPGVQASNIDVQVEEKLGQRVLVIRGKREVLGSENPMTFSKSFPLDFTVDSNQITSKLENGVLVVSAVKDRELLKEKVQTIPVMSVETTDSASENVEPASSGGAAPDDGPVNPDLDKPADE